MRSFQQTPVTKTLLREVHKLSRMYLTLPVASTTSERTFSALRRLKNYIRSTMKQDRLNNCLQIHFHESITDTLDTVQIAKRCACANEQRKGHYGKFERDLRMAGRKMSFPPPPPPPPFFSFQNAPPPPKFSQVM